MAAKKATRSAKPALYAVRWRKEFYFYYLPSKGECTQPGNRYVKAFRTRKAAEAHLAALGRGEVAPPVGANPFMAFRRAARSQFFSGEPPALSDLTSFPEPVFLDWVGDLGLVPPPVEEFKPKYSTPFSMRDWDGWWERNAPTMTVEQRSAVWKALDRLDFYEIVPSRFEG